MLGAAAVIRPGNVAISAVAVLIGAIVAVGPGSLAADVDVLLRPLAFACVAAAIFTGAGNTLNDYFDAETDRVNHPDRPIPRGAMTPRGALGVAVFMFAVALVLGLLINLESLLVIGVNLVAMVSYEVRFKRRGASGNLMIALLVGSLFVFAGTATSRGDPTALTRSFVFALLAALATLGREIAKDIEDMAGDVDRETLPKRHGAKVAGALASTAFLAAVALSPLPYLVGLLPWSYLVVVLGADAILIYCALFSARPDRRIGRVSKYGMVVALAAFLIGALT